MTYSLTTFYDFERNTIFICVPVYVIHGNFYNIITKTDSSYFEIKIQSQKSLCPAIGLTTALLSTGMFYACGWGDEDGKPTYGYHGEDGCIKKNMFDGMLFCSFIFNTNF